MPSNSSRNEKNNFKKRLHRPWNNQHLEEVVASSKGLELAEEVGSEEIFLEDIPSVPQEEPTASLPVAILEEPAPVLRESLPLPTQEIAESNIELIRQQIEETLLLKQREKETVLDKLNSKEQDAFLLGGFCQANSVLFERGHEHGKKVATLMGSLIQTEQDITILQYKMETNQALEEAEKYQLSMRLLEKSKESAERKTQEAILQVKQATAKTEEAFAKLLQMEEKCLQEQEKRLAAEEKERLAYIEANKFALFKKTATEEKMRAEEKMQHAIDQTVNAELLRKKEQELKEKYELDVQRHKQRLLDMQTRYEQLERQYEATVSRVDTMSKRLEQEQYQTEQHQTELQHQQTTTQTLQKDYQALEAEYRDMKSQHKLMSEQLAAAVKSKEEMTKKISCLGQDIEHHKKHHAQQEQKQAHMSQHQEELEDKIKTMTDLIEQERTLRQLSEEKIEHTQAQMQTLKANHKTDCSQYQEQLQSLKTACKNESEKRKFAEHKAKLAVKQAHKTMLDFLEPDEDA